MKQGRGRVKEQRSRRRRNNKNEYYSDILYETIDGNLTHYPYAYCKYHKGWLTPNMALRHSCEKKKCPQMKFYIAENGKPL